MWLHFRHDRIQQAAWQLIPETERAAIHLQIGRALREDQRADACDIAWHLNIGSPLVDDIAERLEVARVNLSAARQAQASNAFVEAMDYLQSGLALPPRR